MPSVVLNAFAYIIAFELYENFIKSSDIGIDEASEAQIKLCYMV